MTIGLLLSKSQPDARGVENLRVIDRMQVPPRIDLQGYLTRKGARVDYIIFWGEPTDIKRRVARDLLRQFENGYEKVLHVPHPGPLTIMRHRQVSLD